MLNLWTNSPFYLTKEGEKYAVKRYSKYGEVFRRRLLLPW